MFASEIALTNAKPDLIIISRSKKICIVFELTAPLEENIVSRHGQKLGKYTKELHDNLKPGWTLDIVCGEVGAKGWIPPSLNRDLRKTFGFVKAAIRSSLGTA